ncbi:TonB-dependent receptor domain-containing protein [Alteraurantiacibacter lauratis]|uniref:TonB-dependent receptor domain-containing protein n=1 Tax=Alteraurantiacibacter lauratis TaxID=2054627 RepID=UPI0036715A86
MSNKQVFKALLLAGGASTFAMAAPVMAQDEGASSGDRIVVTGSRIQRQDFEANSPIVTIDETLLERTSTAALESNLNRLPQFVPAKTPTQGGDIQPTATNTPGGATISLRGIGSNRNLVLLDGRRATPGNASGVVDISTIPAAAVERVEVITGGASATYGADAIAGVTNFILKKNVNGLELDAQANITQEGDGFEYSLSGIMGTDFADGRGNISIAMSLNTREANYQRDRKWYQELWADPTTGGGRFFPLYAGVALEIGNAPNSNTFYNTIFPGTRPDFAPPGSTNPLPGNPYPNTVSGFSFAPGPSFFNVYVNPSDGSLFTIGRNQQGAQGLWDGTVYQNDLVKTTDTGALTFVDTTPYLILPLTRYNALFNGNYEINDWLGVFAQGMFSHVSTRTTQQGGALTAGWDVFFPYGTGVYTGSAIPSTAYGSYGLPSSVILNGMNGYVDPTPGDLTDNPTNPAFRNAYGDNFACALNATGGCTNNELFGQFLPADLRALLDSRANPNGRVDLRYGVPENRSGFNDVLTYQLTAGLEGYVPGTDWTWEVFVNHGESNTLSRQEGIFSLARTRTLFMAPGFGLDFNANSNDASQRFQFGANFARCTSGMNVFQLEWAEISDDCKAAINADLKNRSSIRQTIVEANVQGGLFELPAGQLRFALGASYREQDFEFINDTLTTQGASFLDQAIGIYPSADSRGFYDVHEFYGELLVPVLSDLPLIQEFNLELGGRYSDYSTTGGSWTYKILGDWSVTDWLRIRGGYNRAERAPNIAELFLAPQQTFAINALGDICSEASNYFVSANPNAPGNTAARAADVKAVCTQIMDLTAGAGQGAAYYSRPLAQQPQPGAGFTFPTLYGNPNLRPEVADTWTAGVVIQSPFTSEAFSRMRLSVDWFSIKLKNAIGFSPGASIQQCLDPTYNTLVTGAANSASQALAAAQSALCTGETTRVVFDSGFAAPALGNVRMSFTNDGVVDIQGIDAQIDWAFDLGPGTVNLNLLGNYYLHYKVAELSSSPMFDYAGTFGTSSAGLNPGAYEYRILANLGYRFGAAGINLQWQHLPSVEDTAEATQPTPTIGAPSYNLFNLSGTYALSDAVNLRFGVDNLFNKAPPYTGVNPTANVAAGLQSGGSFNSLFYDTIGRRFFLGANIQF